MAASRAWHPLLAALLLWLLPAAAARAMPGEARIAALVAEAEAAPCTAPDALVAVLCRGILRVGVRTDYARFAERRPARDGMERDWSGFEVDLARALASRLGMQLELIPVTPANRIAMLAERRVDVVIATMGHTVARDGQVRFIRPHYYASRTVIVGDRRVAMDEMAELRGRTVCVTIGNADNARIAGEGARLLLFDSPGQMLDALRLDVCTLAMHDDALFRVSLEEPGFAARFAPKLVVSTLPWGMATRQEDRLAQILDILSARWHAEGVFLALARPHRIAEGPLPALQARWREPGCLDADGAPRAECLAPPAALVLQPSPLAPAVEALERWLLEGLGLRMPLPMLKSQIALEVFLRGIAISLLLVAGALAATMGLALALGAALCARAAAVRIAARAVTGVLQCSPLVLLLFFGYAAVSVILPYSTGVALLLAIMMIGLYNGSHAAGGIADAHAALPAGVPPEARFGLAVRAASVQIMSFLVNATKSTSIASMIGVPELLNALTDITSFTSERVLTYSLLLAFYGALVVLVVWGAGRVQRRLAA